MLVLWKDKWKLRLDNCGLVCAFLLGLLLLFDDLVWREILLALIVFTLTLQLVPANPYEGMIDFFSEQMVGFFEDDDDSYASTSDDSTDLDDTDTDDTVIEETDSDDTIIPNEKFEYIDTIPEFQNTKRPFAVGMSLIEELLEILQILKEDSAVSPQQRFLFADDALKLIFKITLRKIDFNDEEKIKFGNLLPYAFKPIQMNIKECCFAERTMLDIGIRLKRSVFQYIIDYYADFPSEDSTLLIRLKERGLDVTIADLDYVIEMWKDVYEDSDDEYNDSLPYYLGIDTYHTWWY